MTLSSVEICAGAGGAAYGLERAGFEHIALMELDPDACATLRASRPQWNIMQADIATADGRPYQGADLLSGGVPCQPFSVGGKQLGSDDERDLFPHALRLAAEIQPRAVMLENVPGLATAKFAAYRDDVLDRLRGLGYHAWWKVLQSSDYGVPQLRPRFVLVAIREPWSRFFSWPQPSPPPRTVGETLADLMAERGWHGAAAWAAAASGIAPTLAGGSRKHGGADLGPTRAKAAWRALGVNALGVADQAPGPDGLEPRTAGTGLPMLTVRMCARIQGFPDTWKITGRKTAAYRQVGNAFPPPVARAVGEAIAAALTGALPAGQGPDSPAEHLSLFG